MTDFGGTFGLWLGLSIITILEVITFFAELCMTAGKSGAEKAKAAKNERWPSMGKLKQMKVQPAPEMKSPWTL